MKQTYHIHGIKCASCVGKRITLLQNKLSATEISIIGNNTNIEFNTSNKIDIITLNQLLTKIGAYKVSEKVIVNKSSSQTNDLAPSYKSIYLIFTYLIIVNGLIFYENQDLMSLMSNFMSSFFRIFFF